MSERLARIRRVLEAGKTLPYFEQCWMLAELERLSDFKDAADDGLRQMAGHLGVFDDRAGQFIDK